ncbi:MAG: hypothetical protein KAI47_26280 [Deltaproteobacteria bacterium]|nr:hypothetical protein [Deltaproteobacteria bacterium]
MTTPLMRFVSLTVLALVSMCLVFSTTGCADEATGWAHDTMANPEREAHRDGGNSDESATVNDGTLNDGTPNDNSAPDGTLNDGTPNDNSAPDGAQGDESTPCDPTCHWDCFGGYLCHAGKIYELLFWPAPCCHMSDPWPTPDPVCSKGAARVLCPAGASCRASLKDVDERYRACLTRTRFQGYVPGPAADGLLKLFCEGTEPKTIGSPCVSEDDCRPAAVTVAGALRCDMQRKQCVEKPRPPAPLDYGKGCGLLPATFFNIGEAILQVSLPTGKKILCHAIKDSAQGCVRQGRTYPCSFDEDCPTGSICLCGNNTAGMTYCATATDRTTTAGRTAGLICSP